MSVNDLNSPPAKPSQGHFAFARIKGDVFLVQVSPESVPLSPLTTIDVKIFRHDFITIFRLYETKTLHPADIAVIEHIDDFHTLYEEENGTVFLAKELLGRMRKMSAGVAGAGADRTVRGSRFGRSTSMALSERYR